MSQNPYRDEARPQLMDEKAPSPIAFIYRSELDYIAKCVLDYPDIETGGQLFGFWTSQGAPVVLYAIGPGRNANHQPAFFNQDVQYLDSIGNELVERYALQHIGEWHSHHKMGLAAPSAHDAQTMFNGLRNIPQRRLLLCICNYRNGAATINPYNFHEERMGCYEDAAWLVKEMESPFRKLADAALAYKLIHPRTQVAVHGAHRLVCASDQSKGGTSSTIDSNYWLMRPGNAAVMKQMVALVESRWVGCSVKVQAGEGVVQLNISEGSVIVRFPKGFPYDSPVLIVDGVETATGEWKALLDDFDIYDAFCQWFYGIEAMCCQILVRSNTDVSPEPTSEPEPTPEAELDIEQTREPVPESAPDDEITNN